MGISSAAPTAWRRRAPMSTHGPVAAPHEGGRQQEHPQARRGRAACGRGGPPAGRRAPAAPRTRSRSRSAPTTGRGGSAPGKSDWIAGKAMFTMNRSRLARNAPAVTTEKHLPSPRRPTLPVACVKQVTPRRAGPPPGLTSWDGRFPRLARAGPLAGGSGCRAAERPRPERSQGAGMSLQGLIDGWNARDGGRVADAFTPEGVRGGVRPARRAARGARRDRRAGAGLV